VIELEANKLHIKEEKKRKKLSRVKEVDYREDDAVDFELDVYNMTIAAIFTRNCTPMALNYCVK